VTRRLWVIEIKRPGGWLPLTETWTTLRAVRRELRRLETPGWDLRIRCYVPAPVTRVSPAVWSGLH